MGQGLPAGRAGTTHRSTLQTVEHSPSPWGLHSDSLLLPLGPKSEAETIADHSSRITKELCLSQSGGGSTTLNFQSIPRGPGLQNGQGTFFSCDLESCRRKHDF